MIQHKDCRQCDATGKTGIGKYQHDCVCCGGDGKEPTVQQIQDYALRKYNRQYPKTVTVADAMRRFKCEKEKIFRTVGFLSEDENSPYAQSSPYFYICGAPDQAPDILFFDFDGE